MPEPRERHPCLRRIPQKSDRRAGRKGIGDRVGARGGARAVKIDIVVTVNGRKYATRVEPRLLLSDFIRDSIGLTGTHVGCEHGVCGACTILINGDSVRSCLTLAVRADGADIVTVEGLGTPDQLNTIQNQFREKHGLQCGFCTPGMLITAMDLLKKYPLSSDDEIREGLSGNLCRCTGYQNIVAAIRAAADLRNRSAR